MSSFVNVIFRLPEDPAEARAFLDSIGEAFENDKPVDALLQALVLGEGDLQIPVGRFGIAGAMKNLHQEELLAVTIGLVTPHGGLLSLNGQTAPVVQAAMLLSVSAARAGPGKFPTQSASAPRDSKTDPSSSNAAANAARHIACLPR